ncbi:MAG: hypothetical protein HY293_18660 [Planctomycetes bacterium]|nr:hypothetical protein [Planctomycetota bacterium]
MPGNGSITDEGLRAVSGWLSTAEVVGSILGFGLILTGFGICGPTVCFDYAVIVLPLTGFCMAINLAVPTKLRTRKSPGVGALAAFAWLGAPAVLLNLPVSLIWLLGHGRW